MRKICAKFVQRVPREDQKERRCHESREMIGLINSDPSVLDALVTCDESWIYFYDPETKEQSSQWKHASSPRPKKARQSKSAHKLLMIPFLTASGMIYMHWVPTGETINKEDYFEVLREFRNRLRQKRPALFKLGQWHFHQSNAPVHNYILVTDYLSKMGIKTVRQPPYNTDLAPCDFSLFPKLRGCRRRLLRRGLEFHVCTINKNAHTEKVWKLIEGTLYIYIYIYICVYIFVFVCVYVSVCVCMCVFVCV